jgi:hypothetical protein
MIVQGACHCGGVTFRTKLVDGLATARRCTCSYCRMRGAVAVSADISGLELMTGRELLTSYQFNTKTAEHFFCSVCGIYTHHKRRSNPNHYGVNLACLKGMSPFDLEEIPVIDGINHPSDTGKLNVVGVLKFIPAQNADR